VLSRENIERRKKIEAASATKLRNSAEHVLHYQNIIINQYENFLSQCHSRYLKNIYTPHPHFPAPAPLLLLNGAKAKGPQPLPRPAPPSSHNPKNQLNVSFYHTKYHSFPVAPSVNRNLDTTVYNNKAI
jgi:hypothetical protein